MSYMKRALESAANAGCLLVDPGLLHDLQRLELNPKIEQVGIDTFEGIKVLPCLVATDAARLVELLDGRGATEDDLAAQIQDALEVFDCFSPL
jgi:hypothetical protein